MTRGWVHLAALAGAALGVFGCSGDEYTGTEVFPCPSEATFTGVEPDAGAIAAASVSGFMERRCGTLDCHGASSRPMRLYGQLGLRHPTESNVPGGAGTTATELFANYSSVCSVEPEGMARIVDDFGQSAEESFILRKARGIEGHKGGKVVNVGDAADQCLVGWLRGDPAASVQKSCQAAIQKLE